LTTEKTTKYCNKACKRRYIAAWMPAFLVAILPKCPFCVMAYSGAVSLCSGKMLFPNSGSSSSVIILCLSALVILGITLNHRDGRTSIAFLLSCIGVALIAYAQFVDLSQAVYYLGVFLLFFAIWVNGSFLYFYKNYFKHKIQKTQV